MKWDIEIVWLRLHYYYYIVVVNNGCFSLSFQAIRMKFGGKMHHIMERFVNLVKLQEVGCILKTKPDGGGSRGGGVLGRNSSKGGGV